MVRGSAQKVRCTGLRTISTVVVTRCISLAVWLRMASEDIGNADPRALTLCLNAWDVQERLGSPEGELAVAQAITYLACAPKSNAVYSAFNQAKREAAEHGSLEVPLHLRNAPTKLMKELGYGDRGTAMPTMSPGLCRQRRIFACRAARAALLPASAAWSRAEDRR